MKAKKKIDDRKANIEEYIDIWDYLINKRINCFKYNYALDKDV